MNIRTTGIALTAAALVTAGSILFSSLSLFSAPTLSPQSAHSAPENLTEAQQWAANLNTLRSIPAPEATCRVAEWDEVEDGTSRSVSFYRGPSTTVRFTALPDYVFSVADTDLTADNYRAPSNSEGLIPLDTTCVANITTETTVENYGGNLNLTTPVWSDAAKSVTKYGPGFTHVTTGMTAPEFEFRYYDNSATAADVLLKEARSDIYFSQNLANIGQGMENSDLLLTETLDAFGVTHYEGLTARGIAPSDDVLAALNAYANEIIYDYYGS